MLKIFIGYDKRQPLSYNVLQYSIASQSSKPVSITPLVIEQLPIKKVGLTPFTYSRFLVPYLCNYEGWGLFLDADILLKDDISKLFDFADDRYAVMVSKNKIRFEWASVMLFNCRKCKILTPEYIENAKNLHGIGFAENNEIGDIPSEWNHLVGYDKKIEEPKLIHYTQGMPCHEETNTCDFAKDWEEFKEKMNYISTWTDLMGDSVHAAFVNGVRMPRYMVDEERKAIREEYNEKVISLLRRGE